MSENKIIQMIKEAKDILKSKDTELENVKIQLPDSIINELIDRGYIKESDIDGEKCITFLP